MDGYEIVNRRAGLQDAGLGWELTLWVRNLLEQDYIAAVFPVYGVGDYGAYAGDPRTHGVSLRVALDWGLATP